MNGDTDQAEAQAEVALRPAEGWEDYLDEVERVQYRSHLRWAARHREELAAQVRSMKSRMDSDITWRLERGEEVYTNPFTNGGYSFDEAVFRVRHDQETERLFRTLILNRRGRAERAAVVHLASLFKGARLYLPGRKRPYRALR